MTNPFVPWFACMVIFLFTLLSLFALPLSFSERTYTITLCYSNRELKTRVLEDGPRLRAKALRN